MITDARTLRGDILRMVYDVAGTGAKVALRSIKSAYYSYYSYPDINRAVNYLEQKNYITKIEQENPVTHKKAAFYTITPDGQLAVEKTLSDPGILIEEEEEE